MKSNAPNNLVDPNKSQPLPDEEEEEEEEDM